MLFSRGMLLNYIYPLLSLIVTVVTIYLIKLFVESKQKERILDKFSTKVSDAVAQTLLKSKDVDLAGEEREITIFFSDIRNFTTISESFGDPKRLIAYLNRYMSPMSEIIIKNRGTIDKYIGDAIMAYWNAPLRVKRHADLALKTALDQLRWLEHLNRELEAEGLARIDIGIGIHTGLAVVGEMGSHKRSDYTIIGDSVNTASRIEGLCKEFNAKILISEDVKMQLKDEYIFERVGEISLKGKSSKVMIYKVLGEGNVKG
jgi:adenylate cyclase